MWPVIAGGVLVGAVVVDEIGKAFGLWGQPPPPAPPPPNPTPAPNTTPSGQPILTGDPVVDMAAMLAWTGYRMVDMPIYASAQKSLGGLKSDGYPGRHTMAALSNALGGKNIPMPNVPVYPWYGPPDGQYDGVNAPTLAEWLRGAPPGEFTVNTTPGPDGGAAGGDILAAGSAGDQTNVQTNVTGGIGTNTAPLTGMGIG